MNSETVKDQAPWCPYCGCQSHIVDDTFIYKKSYGGKVYVCENYPKCDAYVGCHRDNGKPLGRLANKQLRQMKSAVHLVFDSLWERKMKRDKCDKQTARTAAYKWLAEKMKIDFERCHIGEFDIEQCNRALEICKPFAHAAEK